MEEVDWDLETWLTRDKRHENENFIRRKPKKENEKRKERAICLLRVPTNTVVFYNFDIGRSETGCLG